MHTPSIEVVGVISHERRFYGELPRLPKLNIKDPLLVNRRTWR
jgi:hypothetical protein